MNPNKSPSAGGKPAWFAFAGAAALAVACSSDGDNRADTRPGEPPPHGPFESMTAAANAPAIFTQPRAGVPLAGGEIAFLASILVPGEETEETIVAPETRIAVLLQKPGSNAPSVLYSGERLIEPFDIDVSLDRKTLYIADAAGGADGSGAILTLPVTGGEPNEAATGRAPRSVTVAHDGRVYFSGRDAETGTPGVFMLDGGMVSTVFAGAPLVDPSGIAVTRDDRVLVADTRLSDGAREAPEESTNSEAGIVLIEDGNASVFATGFATGYPAGIALTLDEAALIVSGESPDRSDTVYVFSVANPSAPPTVVTAEFSRFQDSSAGLKRAHDENTFVWASLSVDGGTVYSITAR